MFSFKNNDGNQNADHRISWTLWLIYLLFLAASILIIGKIIYLQLFWEPDKKSVEYFVPKSEKRVINPERGAILDCNGKLLAISTPLYNLYMDCAIQQETFEGKPKKIRDSLESDFRSKLRLMCNGIADIAAVEGRDGKWYYNTIITMRDSKKPGRRNLLLVSDLDHASVAKIKKLPLAENGSYKSGLKFDKNQTRQYPYGSLAYRIIGDVQVDKNDPERNRFVGIEGQYDWALHGKEGLEWMKVTDKGRIVNPDSTVVKAEDGKDIRTTLNIDIQDIADRALRRQIQDNDEIEGGCVILMDVKTGAVKSMVNLYRNRKGEIGEYFNMAIGRAGEPGSVFKAVTLSILLEDNKVRLDTEIPTNGGQTEEMKKMKIPYDETIRRYEANEKKKTITVLDGFKKSSNYVFRYLALENYRGESKEYISRLYEYKLGEAVKFDLTERGGTSPSLPDPESKRWTLTDLASCAIGYTVKETPLNILTFYNAIANKGKMMRPYIVESFEQDGKTVKRFKPEILNGSIFSKATADTLTKALTAVTQEGTAMRLKNAKSVVAGKTGTARVVLLNEERGKSNSPYISEDGKRKFQATFVGFFPADEPKYSAIVTIYTKLTKSQSYGGGNIPAKVLKEIVDEVWALDSSWGTTISKEGKVPRMSEAYIGTGENSNGAVPNVKGLGLKDAIYAIENNGYRCVYQGMGHVASQAPAAGAKINKGETVKIILK